MKIKKWIKIWVSTVFIFLIGIIAINYTVDPLWTFSHANKLNSIQKGFNERQQKTNHIYFNGLDDRSGILLGSSRSTFINQNDFHGMGIYNYAVNGVSALEYNDYINFAKKVNGAELKNIIIGADFYNSMVWESKDFATHDYYTENTTSLFYRFRMLLSYDALSQSLTNIKNVLKGTAGKFYTRDNIKHRPKLSNKERIKKHNKGIKKHTQEFSGSNYRKSTEYITILKQIRQDNPDTRFTVFTSPITADLLTSILVKANRLNEFEAWLKDLIDVFGEVHHFMSINSITVNVQNYADDAHYYPRIATLLANKISRKENPDIPQDFGVILTKSNIDQYIIQLRKQARDYFNNPALVEIPTK